MFMNAGRAAAIPIAVLLSMAIGPLCAQDDLPEGKGKPTLENTCAECHGLDRVLAKLRTSAEWRAVTSRMRSKGATMSDGEFKDLVEYLSQNFGEPEPKTGPEQKPEKVNVNRATAGALETDLGLRPSDASAI